MPCLPYDFGGSEVFTKSCFYLRRSRQVIEWWELLLLLLLLLLGDYFEVMTLKVDRLKVKVIRFMKIHLFISSKSVR